MTPALSTLVARPDRAERALDLALTKVRQHQAAEALSTLEQALTWGADRALISHLLMSGALDDLGRATALASRCTAQPQTIQYVRRSLAGRPGRSPTSIQTVRQVLDCNPRQTSKTEQNTAGLSEKLQSPWGVNGQNDAVDRRLSLEQQSALENKNAVNWVNKVHTKKLTLLADKWGSDKGFKKHLYTTIYQEYIRPGKTIKLLEIGLLCHADQDAIGGDRFNIAPSLDMWCEYLPDARIYGFDIKDFTLAKGSWEKIIRGDQTKRDDLAKVLEFEKELDVIIDDGLHASRHQQISFSFMFQHVKSKGIYIIEDLHYQPAPEPDDIKTVELLKNLQTKGRWESVHATKEEKHYIENNVIEILFFDSMKFPRSTSRNALCIVKKK